MGRRVLSKRERAESAVDVGLAMKLRELNVEVQIPENKILVNFFNQKRSSSFSNADNKHNAQHIISLTISARTPHNSMLYILALDRMY